MTFGVGIGHNMRGAGRLYTIVFDFDTDLLRTNYPGPSWNSAYDDVMRYLTVGGLHVDAGVALFRR